MKTINTKSQKTSNNISYVIMKKENTRNHTITKNNLINLRDKNNKCMHRRKIMEINICLRFNRVMSMKDIKDMK